MKIFFIINQSRRDDGVQDALVAQFRELLDGCDADYEICLSASKEESEGALNDAVKGGFDTLWIGGGDGTLNHALNCTIDSDMTYGIIPMGTVNALAKALRMPLEPLDAARYLLKATPVAMDVGRVAGRYFFTYATVGLHAAVFHNIDTSMKKKWGSLAFWHSAVRTVWNKSRLPRLLLEMELADSPPGEHIVKDYGYSFTVSNLANYAGWATITNEDAASPGYFELHHFRRNRLMPMFVWFMLLRVLGVEKSRPQSGQIFRQIRWVKARSHRKLSVQIDGEPIKPEDRKNLMFECLNDRVRILLCDTEARQLSGCEVPKT